MKLLFNSVHLNGHTLESHPQTEKLKLLYGVQHSNQYNMKRLLNGFHGQTLRFHSET